MNIADPAILRGERRFLPIVALSLLLHAGIFAIVTGPRQPIELPVPALMATLRMMLPPISAPSEPHPHPAAAVAAAQPKARQSSPHMENRSSPLVAGAAAPTTVSHAEAPTAPASAPAAVQPPGPAAPAAAASVAEAPVHQQSELLAGYRQRLTELFARHQEYPRIAAMRGWEGEVRLRLRVARKGNLLAVQVDRSSGFEVLDQHALAMLEGLPGLPPLPDGLDGNEIQVIVPVNYKLKKTT